MLTRGQLCADRALREAKAVGCLLGLAVGDALGDLGRDHEYRKRYGLAIELHQGLCLPFTAGVRLDDLARQLARQE